MANRRNTALDFWPNVIKGERCWVWTGTLWSRGYGRFWFNNKDDRAHRVAWRLSGKALSEDECLLHKCDNRRCVNPAHLFIGTRADNMHDKTKKGRQTKGEACHWAQLKSVDIAAIRASSASNKELAKQYQVSHGHIYKIRSRQVWKHV